MTLQHKKESSIVRTQQPIIMTRSMERVLREKKLSLESILDFKTAVRIFSYNDLAAFIALQSHKAINKLYDDESVGTISTKWTASCDQDTLELVSMIVDLAKSTSVLNLLDEQLDQPKGVEFEAGTAPIQVFNLTVDAYVVVVDRGIKEYLSDDQNFLNVIRVIVGVLLLYSPLEVLVTQRKVFKQWLRLAAFQSVLKPPQPVIS